MQGPLRGTHVLSRSCWLMSIIPFARFEEAHRALSRMVDQTDHQSPDESMMSME